MELKRQLRNVNRPKFRVFRLPCNSEETLQLAAGDYTESNCFRDCQLQQQKRHCGCVMVTELKPDAVNSTYFCFPHQMARCYEQLALE